jgi:hypothetical protein
MPDATRGELPACDAHTLRCKDEARTCTVCGAAIEARPGPVPVCDRPQCRRIVLRDTPAATQRAITTALRASLSAIADRLPATHGRTLALLPVNVRKMEPVSDAAREHFASTLRARAALPTEPAESTAPPAIVDSDPMQRVLQAGCAVCGGACCTRGGTHAFLGASDLHRVADSMTGGDTGGALEALYLSHIPDVHFAGSCVFHAAQGCTLPRALRSSICNRYLCGGLSILRRSMTSDATDTVVVGAATWSHLERATVVDATVAPPHLQPLPLH